MTKTEKDLTLIKRCIEEKWEKIVAGEVEDKGQVDCLLCVEYHHNNCEDCPISNDTNFIWCEGTPYSEWLEHLFFYHGDTHKKVYCSECKKLAQKMLGYLKDLYKKLEDKLNETRRSK